MTQQCRGAQGIGPGLRRERPRADGYAELVIALLLAGRCRNADRPRTMHLTADRRTSVEALERAVGIDPTNRLAVRALAGALIRAGRAGEGKQRLEESERLQARDRRRPSREDRRGAQLNAEMRMAERDYPVRSISGGRRFRCRRKRGHPSPTRGGARRGEPPRRGCRRSITASARGRPDAHRRLASVTRWGGRGGQPRARDPC